VPQKSMVKMDILREGHRTPYTVHPGETTMYRDLKNFWWKRMKFDIAKYVAACGVCQMVKAGHKRSIGLLKPLEIPEWKWENITMDFVVGLPRTTQGKDVIWVVVDRLTKSAHFIPMKTTNSAKELVPLYMKEVLRPHGVHKSIVFIRILSLCSNFGRVCIMLWAQSFLLVLLFILRQMVNQSRLFRPWKICFILVSFLGRAVGKTI
jgi:hypothetical protein